MNTRHGHMTALQKYRFGSRRRHKGTIKTPWKRQHEKENLNRKIWSRIQDSKNIQIFWRMMMMFVLTAGYPWQLLLSGWVCGYSNPPCVWGCTDTPWRWWKTGSGSGCTVTSACCCDSVLMPWCCVWDGVTSQFLALAPYRLPRALCGHPTETRWRGHISQWPQLQGLSVEAFLYKQKTDEEYNLSRVQDSVLKLVH